MVNYESIIGMPTPIVKTTTKEPVLKLPARFFVQATPSRKNNSVKHSLNKFKAATASRGMTFKVVSSKSRPGSAGGARKTRRRNRRN